MPGGEQQSRDLQDSPHLRKDSEFLGAPPEHYDASVADGVLSDAALAAVPSLRALAEAETAALADRTAAAVALVALLGRGLGSAQVTELVTRPGAHGAGSICQGGMKAIGHIVFRWLPGQGREITLDEVRLVAWRTAAMTTDFGGFGLADHEDHHHQAWDAFCKETRDPLYG